MRPSPRSRIGTRAPAVLCLALALAGCGGGGGSSGGAALAPAPTPAPAPEPAPEPESGADPEPVSSTATGFEDGTFPDSALFEAICADPRTGLDPSTGRPWPDVQGTFVDENAWLRSWSHELYLWFDEIEDVDPESLPTPEYFTRMKTFETTPSGAPKDQFHFTQPTDEYRAFAQSGVTAGYGARLAVLSSSPPREVRIAFVDAGSPAEAGGLGRGAEIVSVDGIDVVAATTQADVDVINAALFAPEPGASHVLGVVDRGATTAREVTLTAEAAVSPPVSETRVIDTASGPVGYVAFHDHIAPAEDALVSAIETFDAEGIVDLVVDLRYNGGGFLAIAGELGYMVAGPAAAAGRVFEEIEFNEKHTVRDPVTGELLEPTLFPATTQGFSRPAGDALPSVDLERVFVLTGPGTCSASESFVNGLRGIGVEVVQIGGRTCGKPYGFYPTDNCGTTYFSIQFRGVNADGWGEYADGFAPGEAAGPAGVVPGCVVADDFGADLGDPAEARLAAALAYRETGSCPVEAAGADAATRRRAGDDDRGPALGPPPWRTGAWRAP